MDMSHQWFVSVAAGFPKCTESPRRRVYRRATLKSPTLKRLSKHVRRAPVRDRKLSKAWAWLAATLKRLEVKQTCKARAGQVP